jgi:hypothetical protein
VIRPPPRRRARGAAGLTALLLVSMSCWLHRPSPPRLLGDDAAAPPDVRDACAVTERKCSRCHTIDRVIVAQVTSPRHWETYISRMRRMSASGISEADGRTVLRCLVFRSFGELVGSSP